MFPNHKMNLFTSIQIGITIIVAIILMFLMSRTLIVSTNQYFIALTIMIVSLNMLMYWVKNLFVVTDEITSPSTIADAHADILKDMTTDFELPERHGSGKGSYRTRQSGSAGCPVIAL